LGGAKELKTKPTQASVRDLRSIGIQPDFILARADYPIKKELIKKISLFCDVDEENVIPTLTASSIYQVPINLQEYELAQKIGKKLNMGNLKPNIKDWERLIERIQAKREPINIALVGKYTGLDDSYLSVIESLKIACYHQQLELKLQWIDSEKLEKRDEEMWTKVKEADGVIVPGGFGNRGTEGKIMAAKYCRESKKPYLGLCLGMQMMTIEFARHLFKDDRYTSEEFDEEGKLGDDFYVIHFMPGQYKEKDKGGTLRLGSYPCKITKDTKTFNCYKKTVVEERHRHRYEYNNSFRKKLESAGLTTSGLFPEGNLVEIVEIKNHPFMVGCQFHPEFLSRPNQPHPLFAGLIKAGKDFQKKKK
jgi:CTP synthase